MSNKKSILFATLKHGPYSNHMNSHNELIWSGQTSGKRDHMVVPGTIVCVRKSSKLLQFTVIGTVISKKELSARSTTECARYKLVLKINDVPLIIERAHDAAKGSLTHNAVLRHFGFPEEKASTAKGIYSM